MTKDKKEEKPEEKKEEEKTEEKSEEKSEETNAKPEEEVKKVIPKGFYITEVPDTYTNIIALGTKQILEQELLVKMANALVENGLMKIE